MSESLDALEADFESFHARFSGLFVRSEPRRECREYLRGLLSKSPRRNCWQMAEATGEKAPDGMQRLLSQARWEADAARDILQDYIGEQFGEPEGIAVVDETGFPKSGERSVGVKRQYTGTAGKITNCQVGVFLSYASSRGHVLLDRRLYLPEDWCLDQSRRQAAEVPESIEFRTKPQLAIAMLEHAVERQLPLRWVVADEVYGNADYFRAGVSALERWYVVTVASGTPVWLQRPQTEPARYSGSGRLSQKARVSAEALSSLSVAELLALWPPREWKRVKTADGEKGPVRYDWACRRVVERRNELPGEEVWLLVRRSLKDATDLAYYLSNAPADTPLATLAQVASTRWTIEQCFRESKGHTGLDEYEVRLWQSWHRHITLVMMAHAWLAAVRGNLNQKKGSARRRDSNRTGGVDGC